MRPLNGLRPVTPPIKHEEIILIPKDDADIPKVQIEEMKIIEEVKDKHDNVEMGSQILVNKSSVVEPANKKLDNSKGKLNKSFENYHTFRGNSKPNRSSRTFRKRMPITSNSENSKSSADPKGSKRKALQSSRGKSKKAIDDSPNKKKSGHHTSSLPATPRIPTTEEDNKPQLRRSIVATLFKDLKLNSKKKKTNKHQQQQYFAQTSPALTAILKSLKDTARQHAEEASARTERPANSFQLGKKESLSKKAKKANAEEGHTSLIAGTTKFKLKLNKKGQSAKKKQGKSKARIKSKSQAQHTKHQYVPVQTINITTDQISIGATGENRFITPIRSNIIEGNQKTESTRKVNQTY